MCQMKVIPVLSDFLYFYKDKLSFSKTLATDFIELNMHRLLTSQAVNLMTFLLLRLY